MGRGGVQSLLGESGRKSRLFIDRGVTFRRDENSSTGDDKEEVEANQLGAALLMPVVGSVLDGTVLKRLNEADFIFGCVDKDFPRMILCQYAYQYRVPYIDVGAEIGGDDEGIVSTDVGLVRHGHRPMTPALGAMQILSELGSLDPAVKALADRAQEHSKEMSKDESDRLRLQVRGRCLDLLDSWAKEAQDYASHGVAFQYNLSEAGGAKPLLYDFLSPEVKTLPPTSPKRKFRANRSLRDVEAAVNIWVKTLDNVDLEDDAL